MSKLKSTKLWFYELNEKFQLYLGSYIRSKRILLSGVLASGLSVLSVLTELILTSGLFPFSTPSDSTINTAKLIIVFGAAVIFFLALPIRHYWKEGPIYASMDWYPQWWEDGIHKSKKRGELKLPESGQMRIIVTTELLDSVESYRFKLESSGGISFSVDRNLLNSSDQTTNPDCDEIICKSVIHSDFVNTLIVEKEGPLGGGDNHFVSLKDVENERNKTLLRVEVRE